MFGIFLSHKTGISIEDTAEKYFFNTFNRRDHKLLFEEKILLQNSKPESRNWFFHRIENRRKYIKQAFISRIFLA